MAVIKYVDSQGNVRTLNSIKGDRGPVGPRGYSGPKGDKGEKGGTIIKGSKPTFEDLVQDQPAMILEIGDGYLIEDENILCIWDGEKWIKDGNYIPVQLDDLVDVQVSNDLDNATVLVYDSVKKIWTNKHLDVDAGLLSTNEDIKVTVEGGLGSYNENDIIPTGTTFTDFVKNIVHKAKPPEYIKPTLNISCDLNRVEIGSYISPVISIEFTQNDAGAFKLCRLFKDNSLIDIFTEYVPEINILPYVIDKTSVFKIEIEYESGIIKNDSDNNPFPEGHIITGSIIQEVSIISENTYWYYQNDTTEIPTVDSILNGIKNFDISKGSKITLDTNDTTKSIVFAYPKYLGECSEIDYVGFDKHNKDVFECIQLEMNTPSGAATISYYIYYFIAPIEIGPATFILTV